MAGCSHFNYFSLHSHAPGLSRDLHFLLGRVANEGLKMTKVSPPMGQYFGYQHHVRQLMRCELHRKFPRELCWWSVRLHSKAYTRDFTNFTATNVEQAQPRSKQFNLNVRIKLQGAGHQS